MMALPDQPLDLSGTPLLPVRTLGDKHVSWPTFVFEETGVKTEPAFYCHLGRELAGQGLCGRRKRRLARAL